MSYGKKDEDVEGAILKVDRTAVFQEGRSSGQYLCSVDHGSSTVQLLPHIAPKMSDPPYKDRSTSLHGGFISTERGYRFVLWHLQTFPEQRPLSTADDVSCLQGAGELCFGCDYDDTEHHEGHWCQWRCFVQGQCYSSLVQNHRCKLTFEIVQIMLMLHRLRRYKPLKDQLKRQ